jgi:hypothetical protein
MKEKDFDNIVRKKLEAINEAPPAYMWDRVASGMAAQSGVNTTSGLSATKKILLVAASIVFIVGLVAIFSNQNRTTKRHVSRPFKKSWHKKQLIKSHKRAYKHKVEPVASKSNLENPNTSFTHTPKNKQTINSPSKTATTTPIKNIVGVKTSKKQNAMVNNQKDEFPPLPSATEIRKAESVTSASANNQPTSNTKKEAKNFGTSYELAVVPPIPLSNSKTPKANTEKKQTATPYVKDVSSETQNTSTENKSIATSESTTEINQDTSSTSVKQVEVIAGELPNDLAKTPNTEQETSQQQNPKSRIFNKYGIGIHYGPEFMDIDNYKLTDQALDLSFNYQNMNLIIQTGLGVRFSEDQATYDIKYKRWEYWKTQVRFDSASLYVNSNGDTIFQPANVYYEEIYDSLSHSYQATAKEHYTILQIPILLGYQIDYDKFAIFIKGGIRYSLIAYQQNDDLFIPDENSRITDYNYPIKTRAKSNIDYELALGGAYKINKHFQIQAEAFGRFYHYSIYEENPPSGIHPWSLSIRAGLIYIF